MESMSENQMKTVFFSCKNLCCFLWVEIFLSDYPQNVQFCFRHFFVIKSLKGELV